MYQDSGTFQRGRWLRTCQYQRQKMSIYPNGLASSIRKVQRNVDSVLGAINSQRSVYHEVNVLPHVFQILRRGL